jgi:hypothetical protein
MTSDLARLGTGSISTCVSSWLALAFAAGNVGLQQSISNGATTLFERPVVLVLVAVAAFGVAFVSARTLHLRPAPLLIGVLLGDAIAGLVLAPIAVGELEPLHAPLVFAAVSVLGIQPAAALAGGWAAHRLARGKGHG